MGEAKSGLFSGLKNILFEEDTSTQSQVAQATPAPASQSVVAPVQVAHIVGTDVPTEEELKAAENLVATWTNFKNLENLKKFASIEAKLKSKIIDPAALRVASFEMAEVAGVSQKAVVEEAKGAVSQVLVKLSESTNTVQNELANIDKQEVAERQQLEAQAAELEKNLLSIRERLSGLSANANKAKTGLLRRLEVTKQVAGLFVEQWSPLGK